MSYWDKECPRDPNDAFREGRRSRETERNPYEHGRDPWADRDCREAHEEWARGHRYAEYAREDQRREEEEQRRQERARQQREHEDPYGGY